MLNDRTGGVVSPKLKIEITSGMTRRSDSDAEKMTGTSIDSPKLDSLEPAATTILQQNWRGGREVGNHRGEVRKTPELMRDVSLHSTQYFYFPDEKNDSKKLSAAPNNSSNSLKIDFELKGSMHD